MKTLVVVGFALVTLLCGSLVWAQKSTKKHTRAVPPNFQPNEFSGVFFPDAISQLQGDKPNLNSALADIKTNDNKSADSAAMAAADDENAAEGKGVWKSIVSGATLEDLVKESKSRLDGIITTPAKFAGGGVAEARREFTLLASSMAVIHEYPEPVKWQSSASYAQRIFARMALNCKVGTQPVFNEAKLRQQDLQTLLNGSKLAGNADEVGWPDTADHGPVMQLMEWALRENLAPNTNNEKRFRDSQDDVVKYSELIAMFGQIIQEPGMNLADDEQYLQYATSMTKAAQDVTKAARMNDPELARTAVGRIDQACSKCHESYR
jgi:hypothetical protein